MYIHTYICVCLCVCVCVCVCVKKERRYSYPGMICKILDWPQSSCQFFHVLRCAQVCLTLCDPVNCSPPGSSVHGSLQARVLEWAATPSSRGSSPPRDQTQVSHIAGSFFTPEPPGKPDDMGWVACPFSSRSSRPGNCTSVSCIAGQFFTS